MKNYRHGDIVLIGMKQIPKLKAKAQQEVHGGSHGHPHSIVNGKFYPHRTGENILGYLEAKNSAYLTHAEHGEVIEGSTLKQAPIEAGFYEVRVQMEDGHEGMREVVD